MAGMPHILQRVLTSWWALLTSEKAVRDYLVFAAILAVTIVLDRLRGGDWRRYLSRGFATDVAYYVFYYGGFFALLYSPLGGAMVRAVDRFFPPLHASVMRGWPPALQIVFFIVFADFVSYWQHRLLHRVPALWAVHQIHHSQRNMTVMTNFRFHFLEESVRHLVGFIPFVLLGSPVAIWVAADIFMAWLLLMQHSTLHWSFGPLDHLFASPRYHELHHAREERLHDHNFAAIFSFWDRLFGTQDISRAVITDYGTNDEMPESFTGQLLVPMRAWGRKLRAPQVTAPVVPEEAAS